MRLFILIAILTLGVSQVLAQTTQPSAPAATQPAASIPFAPVAHVEKQGTGPIHVVLIPGLSCDWTVYESFMQRNGGRYSMYALTLPGFGGSAPPAKPPGLPNNETIGLWLDNAAKAVWQVVQDHKLEKPIIIGHSLGGHLALRLGIEHAEHIGAVISIDGPPASPLGDMSINSAERREAARKVASLFGSFGSKQWQTHQRLQAGMMVRNHEFADWLGEMFNAVPPEVTIRYMADYIGSDLREDLSKLPQRTLAVVAIATGDLNEQEQQQARLIWGELFANAPQAKLVFFEHTRHFVQLDRPTELDSTIADFLAGREVNDFITHEYDSPPSPPTATAPATAPATSSPQTQPEE